MDSLIWAASRLSTEGNSARPRRKLWAAMGAAAPDPIPRDRVHIPVFSRWLICAVRRPSRKLETRSNFLYLRIARSRRAHHDAIAIKDWTRDDNPNSTFGTDRAASSE